MNSSPVIPAPHPMGPVPGSGADLLQRAGDRERTAVCDQLSSHYAAGRLRADELDARLGAAVQAATLLELRQLVQDLPALPRPESAPPVTAPRVRSGLLDLLALLTVIGALGVAGLLVLVLGAEGQFGLIVVGFLGGSTAALGGGALTHLLHRAARNVRDGGPRQGERADQRPRIA